MRSADICSWPQPKVGAFYLPPKIKATGKEPGFVIVLPQEKILENQKNSKEVRNERQKHGHCQKMGDR